MWQFSVKALVALTVVAAVSFTVLIGLPDWLSVLMLMVLGVLLVPSLLSVAIYARGAAQAFAIGSLVMAGLPLLLVTLYVGGGLGLLFMEWDADSLAEAAPLIKGVFGGLWLLGGLAGLLCAGVRQLVLPPREAYRAG